MSRAHRVAYGDKSYMLLPSSRLKPEHKRYVSHPRVHYARGLDFPYRHAVTARHRASPAYRFTPAVVFEANRLEDLFNPSLYIKLKMIGIDLHYRLVPDLEPITRSNP